MDPVKSPSHYTRGKIETIEYIEDKNLGFCLGNSVKYITRAGHKDPAKEIEDLQKAIWYIERHIKMLKKDQPYEKDMNPRPGSDHFATLEAKAREIELTRSLDEAARAQDQIARRKGGCV